MNILHNRFIAIVLLLGVLYAPHPVRAAESYDNCAGFVDSVPATISTQGVWCLRKDLATAIASGVAITIAANNVTIDCNGYKLGGLAAGTATEAVGIYAINRQNGTVRNCNIRGFMYGIRLDGNGAGHLVEENRLDNNTLSGIYVRGDNSTIRRNLVFDTGGVPDSFGLYAIYAYFNVDVLDNTVSGVVATPGSGDSVVGIYAISNDNGTVAGNRVRNLVPDSIHARGISVSPQTSRATVRDNILNGGAGSSSNGIDCPSFAGSTVQVRDNIINGFVTGIAYCADAGGNVVVP